MESPLLLLRARAVLPVAAAPVDDGAVLVHGNRIAAVGRFADVRQEAAGVRPVDLGEAALIPGLINAHCHLDYTEMTGLPSPKYFSDWIKSLLTLKAAASYTDYAAAWLRGAQMLARNGVTTVGDIEAVPELLPDVLHSTPLRVLSFLEMTGVKSRRDPAAILGEATDRIALLPAGRCWGGLSPHALYSTSPALLQASGVAASERGWRVTAHLAESAEEAEMYASASGPLYDWSKGQRDMSDCGGTTCVKQAARCGLLGENFLGAHCNYISEEDAALLGRHKASVAHCPRSHAYFGHAPFPMDKLVKHNVNVCLGTDSLASVSKLGDAPLELSLFAEMRLFAARHAEIAPAKVLEMATVNAARALGRSGELGELTSGALADVVAVPADAKMADLPEAVAHHAGPAAAVMIDGRWVVPPKL